MNKDSIYKIIGYRGEYNQNVKKALKRLLKENHPDNNGNQKIFEIICEVKDELENNKVSYKVKTKDNKTKSSGDINFEYCHENVIKLTKDRKEVTTLLNNNNELLKQYEDNYKKLYQDSIDLEAHVLSNSIDSKRLNRIKTISILILLVLIVLFVLSIYKNSLILFTIFAIISILCIMIIQRYFYIVNDLVKNNKKRFKKYIGVIKEIKSLRIKEDNLRKEILVLERKKKNIDNDIRFYKNLIK